MDHPDIDAVNFMESSISLQGAYKYAISTNISSVGPFTMFYYSEAIYRFR